MRFLNILQKKSPKRLFLLLFLGSFFVISSCGSSRTGETINDYDGLQQLVSSREFEVENQWAQPLTGTRVNLIGNTNYMRFKNDSIELHLPYFGVRHAGGAYDREGGINYKGALKDLEIDERPGQGRILISFEGQQDSEDLWFSLILFSNGKVDTTVKSSQRNTISYDGEVSSLPEKFK